MDKRLYTQAYNYRDLITDKKALENVMKALAGYGFAGIHAAGPNFGWEHYKKACDAAGLTVIGGHFPIDSLEDGAEAKRIAETLGTKYLGCGGMPGIFARENFSEAEFAKNLERIQSISEKLAAQGYKFTYHHHSNEFAKIKGEFIFDILRRELDPKKTSFVLDTYWVVHAGVDLYGLMESLAGRIDILHLKDKKIDQGFMDGHITELGAGTLDFPRIVKLAEDIGVEYLCYEQDNGFEKDPLDSAEKSAEYFYSLNI